MAKCCKLIREIPANPLGDSGNILNFLAITLDLEMLESIKVSKDSYYSLEFKTVLSHKIGSLDQLITS